MATKDFTTAWQELSGIQQKAAEWDEGPLLVLAGPGSGKTRVLTCRIARILDLSRGKTFRILGLTFTNKAADEMRTRVTNFVPGEEGRLFLGTFHSFCADILRQHGTHLGINPNFQIYAQKSDIQAVLDEAVNNVVKKHPEIEEKLVKSLQPVIDNLKSRLIPPADGWKHIANEDTAKRIALIYPAYEAELANRNALDFNSLIMKAYELFTKYPALAQRYRVAYPYICIDEFQDTNEAQYRFIHSLTGGKHKNIYAVADDDQIIYQWNGASHKRLNEFRKDYSPDGIQLPMNYRCPPEVVAIANNLISHNLLRTANKEPLQAFRSSTGPNAVRLLPCFSDQESEVGEVAQDIRKLHADHLGEVVILARNRKLLDVAEAALHDEGLPALISQRKDEFESSPLAWLHSMLRLASDKQDQKSLEAVCGSFGQLTGIETDPLDVLSESLSSNLGYLQDWIKVVRKSSLSPLIKEGIDKSALYLCTGKDFQSFSRFAFDWFAQLAKIQQDPEDPSIEVFARYEEEKRVWDNLVREISSALGIGITLEAFLQELQLHSKEPLPQPNTVTLMTIHGVKGKEFEHVYVTGLVEDELPSYQSKKKGDDTPEMEEERRSCYVAITRTIKTLTLSYAERYRGYKKEPSRFLSECGLLED
jgi:DNA helicase II / ATP-dependent DNA helicase PcrA